METQSKKKDERPREGGWEENDTRTTHIKEITRLQTRYLKTRAVRGFEEVTTKIVSQQTETNRNGFHRSGDWQSKDQSD